MPEQSVILERVRDARREEALEVAKTLLNRMGDKAKDELLGHLASVDLDFALGRTRGVQHLSVVVGDTIKDLEALGIELPKVPRLIIEAGSKNTAENQINPEELSQKELELWMAHYFKDTESRKKIVELFWGKYPAYSRGKKDFVEVARKISDVLNVPKQEAEGKTLVSMGAGDISLIDSSPRTNNLYHAGKTEAEVRANKLKYGRDQSLSEVEAEIIEFPQSAEENRTEVNLDQEPVEPLPQKKESAPYANDNNPPRQLTEEESEFYERYRDWRIEQIQAYIESEFSYCVFTLFQEVETLIWFSAESDKPLQVSTKIQQKLDLIHSLAEVYGLYDYSEHFEPAVKAFITYYLPRFNQVA